VTAAGFEQTWTATVLCVAEGLTVDQVVSVADDLHGDACYDAITRVLNADFEVVGLTHDEAEINALLQAKRTALSQFVVSVTVHACQRNSPKPDRGRKLDELIPGMGGCWLIVTQGSCHMWDLDSSTYIRIPGSDSNSGPFAFDRLPMAITRVDRWPRVGSTSLIWYDDPSNPDRREHWRQSSRIISISEIPSATGFDTSTFESTER
jgi:hypothetical protein